MLNVKKFAICLLAVSALTMYGCVETEVDKAMAKAAYSKYYTSSKSTSKNKYSEEKTTAATKENKTTAAAESKTTAKATESTTKTTGTTKTTKATESTKSTKSTESTTKATETTSKAAETSSVPSIEGFRIGDSVDTVFAIFGKADVKTTSLGEKYYSYSGYEAYGYKGSVMFYTDETGSTISEFCFYLKDITDDGAKIVADELATRYGKYKTATNSNKKVFMYTFNLPSDERGYNFVVLYEYTDGKYMITWQTTAQ